MICGKIIQECEQRPVCFNYLIQSGYRYANMYHNGFIFGNIAFIIVNSDCLLHTEVNCWTKGIAKTMVKAFYNEFFPFLKEKKVKKIAAFREGTLETDKAWVKFVQMFGFNKPINCMYTERKL
jgi:hypothetical protein